MLLLTEEREHLRLLLTLLVNDFEILSKLGFHLRTIQSWLDEGCQLYYFEFEGTENYEPLQATWENLLNVILSESPVCHSKVFPHIEQLKSIPVEQYLHYNHDENEFKIPANIYACVNSFENFARCDLDELMIDKVTLCRYFLRATLKCTPLFRGDGWLYL